jgi:hypothetical protein
VTLDRNTLTLEIGDKVTLVATVTPSDATDKTVTWSSSNPGIASVSPAGVVTGLAGGDVIITVTTNDGELIARCRVIVTEGWVAEAWSVTPHKTFQDETWGTVNRSPYSEIDANSIEFTQAQLNRWNTDLDISDIIYPAIIANSAPLPRYVEVVGKRFIAKDETESASGSYDFDKVELVIEGVGTYVILAKSDWTRDKPGSWVYYDTASGTTYFKYAINFASREPSTGKWTIRPERSDKALTLIFYKGEAEVQRASGGKLPKITIKEWDVQVFLTASVAIAAWGINSTWRENVDADINTDIDENSKDFTQKTLGDWASLNGSGNVAELAIYVTVDKKLGATFNAGDFDYVHNTFDGKMSQNSNLDPPRPYATINLWNHQNYVDNTENGYPKQVGYAYVDETNNITYFKHAIQFAQKVGSTWKLDNAHGVPIEYLFYKGGRFNYGGELVGTAIGVPLPNITLSD